jgi:hypothetical protein
VFRLTIVAESDMKKLVILGGVTLVFAALGAVAFARQGDGAPASDTLYATVSKLDSGLFDSFNHCDSAGELQKHASYLAPNLEFYHDTGGVTWSRHDYLANTERNVCGVFRRELVAGSLEVFPVKDYGAIEQGVHRFCGIKDGKCFGEAQFLILWHRLHDGWEATRIFSYGHHAMGSGSGDSSGQTH